MTWLSKRDWSGWGLIWSWEPPSKLIQVGRTQFLVAIQLRSRFLSGNWNQSQILATRPLMGSLQHGFLLISRPSRVLVSLKDLPDYVGLTHENLSPFQLTERQLIRKLNYIYKIPFAIKCNIIMGVILHCIRKSCLLGAGLLEAILEFCLPQLCVTKTRFFTCLYKLSLLLSCPGFRY